jgi:hypothetical protein
MAATPRLFVLPDVNAPARADAIFVLGGNGAGPEDGGIRLAEEGYATTLVFSLVPSQTCAYLAITKITAPVLPPRPTDDARRGAFHRGARPPAPLEPHPRRDADDPGK